MKRTLIAGTVAALFALPTLAANVPAGTQLLPGDQQIFVRNIGSEPASIDPQMVEESSGSDIVNDLFEGLYTLDGDGKLQAAGALGYELDTTGTVYTFKLRPEAKWSNGEPVTAADYVYGWQRAADPRNASNYAWFIELTGVTNASDVVQGKKSPDALGIKALDTHTLQITLNNPVPFFLKTLSHYTTFPAPKATIEKFGHEWVKPGNIVSNGAFMLKEWTPPHVPVLPPVITCPSFDPRDRFSTASITACRFLVSSAVNGVAVEAASCPLTSHGIVVRPEV